ncbi:hypothetical protein C7212DRAFT_326060 [Tuber magnatum]|uniref:Uncharacterized protein n=1 Tax=Tuber magnatum TaxID=42249 RepID=A0A317SL13_9PEZI|nr:hypothetical protein C7212DRAFT_326060 [Tuber magnatum]
MKKQPIPQILYKFLFPNPGPKDPASFDQFVHEVLDPEIRTEIAEWYNCHTPEELEEVYPGWDYADSNVRMRLSRYKGHNKLFKAFDKLGLSAHEINSVVTWHGTRWELEDWEAEAGSIRDRDPSIYDEVEDYDYDDEEEEEEEEEEEGGEAGVAAARGEGATQGSVTNTNRSTSGPP